jgi:hypothetical protein
MTRFHGSVQTAGGWSSDGMGQRRHQNMSISHEGLVPLSSHQDFVQNNSYFANGAPPVPQSTLAREVHLDSSLVPFAAPSPSGARSPAPYSPVRHHQLSAIRFEDSSSQHLPQRVFVDGAWLLSMPQSMPQVSTPEPRPAMAEPRLTAPEGRRSVRAHTDQRQLQLENAALADARTAQQRRAKRRHLDEEADALEHWGSRWGFYGAGSQLESPSRRRGHQMPISPTLAGFQLATGYSNSFGVTAGCSSGGQR